MSSAEAFSYALLLKGAGRAREITALLETEKQQEVQAVLERLKNQSAAAIRQLWSEQRRTDELAEKAGA
jgi:hypothetical protein